jgi:uncharacterized protein (DUF302 family)
MSQPLAFQTLLDTSYEDAIERVTAALKVEGFGVLTRIDVRATIKEKLNEDFRPYVILGACNPHLAHRALTSEPLVGMLLPCNVTVEEQEGGVLVSIVNPDALFTAPVLQENSTVCEAASEARAALERVIQSL